MNIFKFKQDNMYDVEINLQTNICLITEYMNNGKPKVDEYKIKLDSEGKFWWFREYHNNWQEWSCSQIYNAYKIFLSETLEKELLS